MKEQHKEVRRHSGGWGWRDEALQRLAQRSGSAGNYNHNRFQCTSYASYSEGPRHRHSQQIRILSHSRQIAWGAEFVNDNDFISLLVAIR